MLEAKIAAYYWFGFLFCYIHFFEIRNVHRKLMLRWFFRFRPTAILSRLLSSFNTKHSHHVRKASAILHAFIFIKLLFFNQFIKTFTKVFFEFTKLYYKLFLFLIHYYRVIFHLKYLVDQLIEFSELKTYHCAEVVNNLIIFVG